MGMFHVNLPECIFQRGWFNHQRLVGGILKPEQGLDLPPFSQVVPPCQMHNVRLAGGWGMQESVEESWGPLERGSLN